MNFHITHLTRYTYAALVMRSQHRFHLTPRQTSNQRVRQIEIEVTPQPAEMDSVVDFFGNTATYATIDSAHEELVITARCDVSVHTDTRLMPTPGPTWETVRDRARDDRSPEGLSASQFIFDSPMAPTSPELAAFAQPSFGSGRPFLQAVTELNHRIYTELKYDPMSTTVSTPVHQVLRQQSGVCQDFAHLMIGCLRSLGIPARYVSGYVRSYGGAPAGVRPAQAHAADASHTQKQASPAADATAVAEAPSTRGAGASHAWLAVHMPDVGWIDFDPTNDSMPNHERTDHITLAWGRDYTDVPPVKGVSLGGGQHKIDVSVDVEPVES